MAGRGSAPSERYGSLKFERQPRMGVSVPGQEATTHDAQGTSDSAKSNGRARVRLVRPSSRSP